MKKTIHVTAWLMSQLRNSLSLTQFQLKDLHATPRAEF